MSESRRLPVAETAKLVRKALKAAHPGVKFSVRSNSYAGGASIDVSWTDGPTGPSVDAVISPYAGARFDGMVDLKSYAEHWLCPHEVRVANLYGHSYGNGPVDSRHCAAAELVHFGADYVHSQRRLSPEFRAELEAAVSAETGLPYDPNTRVWDCWMSDLVYRESVKTARVGS